MSNAADERGSVDLDPDALEAHYADALGRVRAAQILARRVVAIDRELERLERLARIGGAASSDEIELQRQLREQALEDFQALRGRLHA
jgi:hypothetical protein